MTTDNGTIGRYLGWLLAALSAGAGVIHFAVAGGHFDVGWWHGFFFAVIAWLQLSWAAAVVVRPTRPLLAVGAVVNFGAAAVWLMSRTVGVPVGPDAWESEPVSLADGLATGFEVSLVVLALAVLLRPAFAQRTLAPRLGLAGLGATGVAIAVVSTVALTPSFASDHHGAGGHSGTEEEAAHSHDGATAEDHDMTADEHANMDDDAGADAGADHAAEAVVISADGSTTCEQSGFDGEAQNSHGHRGPAAWEDLDAATRDQFREQVRQSDAVVAANPTVADAEANGYKLVTQYVPCIGAHYIKYTALSNGFDPAEPEVILFGGQDPDSQVVGLSYLQFGDPELQPDGFIGDNDGWHIHDILCANPTVGIVGDGLTDEECEARGGNNLDTARLWMMHMWNAPGWPSAWGLFSSEHPSLGGTFRDING